MAKQKRENFVRLAENRTNKIIEMVRLLGNLSNTSNYSYTKADVNKIFNTLEKELADAKRKFDTIGSDDKFTLL